MESLVEAHMALLEHHVNTEVSSLRVLRGPLQQAVREFPDNVYLLVMYAKLESRYSNIFLHLKCCKIETVTRFLV